MVASSTLLALFSGCAPPPGREQDLIYCPHTSPEIHADGWGKNNAISMATLKAPRPPRAVSLYPKSGTPRAQRGHICYSALHECETKEHAVLHLHCNL
jgi:hypothetical protein